MVIFLMWIFELVGMEKVVIGNVECVRLYNEKVFG